MNGKHHWQCIKGHDWWANTSNVYNLGRWCPYCAERKTERAVRKIFSNLFNKRFVKVRPKWLTYTEKRLELDGYCKELKLAFEYNGMQHYELTYFNKNNPKKLAEMQARDKFKQKSCKERGIILISIPYTEQDNLEQFILSELKKNNIKIPMITLDNFEIINGVKT